MLQLTPNAKTILDSALTKIGSKSTKQREHVFAMLLTQRDHPTAEEVYNRLKDNADTASSISLATVYNCLETLVASGLVKQVNIEREPNRYCPNLAEHAHFHCKKTGRVYDIDLPFSVIDTIKKILPPGYSAECVKITFEGLSPEPLPSTPPNTLNIHI